MLAFCASLTSTGLLSSPPVSPAIGNFLGTIRQHALSSLPISWFSPMPFGSESISCGSFAAHFNRGSHPFFSRYGFRNLLQLLLAGVHQSGALLAPLLKSWREPAGGRSRIMITPCHVARVLSQPQAVVVIFSEQSVKYHFSYYEDHQIRSA